MTKNILQGIKSLLFLVLRACCGLVSPWKAWTEVRAQFAMVLNNAHEDRLSSTVLQKREM